MEKPAFGVMFDLGRALERRDYYRQAIDFLAERGANTVLWHFTDDQGCGMNFQAVPGVGSPHAYTPAETRELVAYATSRGIDLIPEVASLGHTVYLTRLPQYHHLAESDEMFSSLCPVAPEIRPLLKSLIEEAVTVFDSPNFHVGLDESNFGHHPLSAAALKTRSRAEIFADHINFIHGVVTGLGKRMWMWADGLLKDHDLAHRLPRDIVMCNWKYRPTEPTDSTQYLLDQGFDVVLCSASISSQQMLFPGDQFALPNIRSLTRHNALRATVQPGGTIVGQLNTIWTPVRYLAGALWPGIDLALAIMQHGPDANLTERMAAFGRDHFGLTDTADWVSACQVVVRLSPRRDEWLAVLNLQPTSALKPAIAAAAPRWAEAHRLLGDAVEPQVARHDEDFLAFGLMVELATHMYCVAARLDHMDADDACAAAVVTRRLLREVEATWDRERYPDDPRKFAAPIAHFAEDHLIPMIRIGLKRLEAMGRAVPVPA